MNPKSRQERLVFVDPEDEEISYWWPAIVVPEDEYELFKETMTNEDEADFYVGELERLVCYFEDGSFSVVPKSGLIPFNPLREPFKSYSMRLKHFLNDSGVKSAVAFHEQGVIPKIFKWLILSETGYLDIGDDKRDEEEKKTSTETKKKIKRELKMNKSTKSSSKDSNLKIEIDNISPSKTKTYNEHNHKVKSKDKSNEEKSRRGRKPKPRPESNEFEKRLKSKSINETETEAIVIDNSKRNTNTLNSAEFMLIPSPTPMNPAEMVKIEALLSAAEVLAEL